jgi:hypothetical protein
MTNETGVEVVIDTQDGAGVQKFQADSESALIEKLREAQVNASKKIREQAAALRAYDAAPNLTEAEKAELAERLRFDFDAAEHEFVSAEAESKVRAEEDERRREAERAAQELAAVKQFVDETPGYFVSERNALKLLKWIETQGRRVNVESLCAAFEDLSASGLLETRAAERAQGREREESHESRNADMHPKSGLSAAEASLSRRKVVGGLSAKRSAPVMTRRYELEQPRINPERMTTEQLRELALKSL